MPFRFKLEPIKRLREHDELQERIKLGREIQRLTSLNGQLKSLHEQMTTAASRFASANDAVSLQAQSEFYGSLTAEHAALSGLIAQQQGIVAEARRRHQEARTRLRTFERLEERARDRYRHEQLAREQRFLDEIAVIGAAQ